MTSPLFGPVDRLEAAMTFHRERHTVLSGNVANADTPGFEPIDIEAVEPAAADATHLAQTQPGHLDLEGASALSYRSFKDPSSSRGADGNAVSVERELAKIDANRLRYSTATELVSRRLALLRYAAGDGNG